MLVTLDGTKFDLLGHSPNAVRRVAAADAQKAMLNNPGLWQWGDKVGVPAIALIRRLLGKGAKEKDGWARGQAGALRSLVIGSQWPQARLHETSLAEDNRCQLCMEAAGTLCHRH